MDAFNYLAVMLSIVLGLGLTQLFAGIGNLVQIRRRVKRFWLHTVWVLLLIVLHVHMWWSFWALRGVTHWTYATFVYVLVGPALLVIASHIIIPEPVMGLRSFFVPFRLFQTIAVVAFGSCAASKNKYLHACAIVLITAILVASITIARTPFRQFELR